MMSWIFAGRNLPKNDTDHYITHYPHYYYSLQLHTHSRATRNSATFRADSTWTSLLFWHAHPFSSFCNFDPSLHFQFTNQHRSGGTSTRSGNHLDGNLADMQQFLPISFFSTTSVPCQFKMDFNSCGTRTGITPAWVKAIRKTSCRYHSSRVHLFLPHFLHILHIFRLSIQGEFQILHPFWINPSHAESRVLVDIILLNYLCSLLTFCIFYPSVDLQYKMDFQPSTTPNPSSHDPLRDPKTFRLIIALIVKSYAKIFTYDM